MAIKRIWHGWTAHENADVHQRLQCEEVIPGIEIKNIAGYRGIELPRRALGDEVEFVTIMTFDSIQNVIDFQGEDYQRCYVPDAAQTVLSVLHPPEHNHAPKEVDAAAVAEQPKQITHILDYTSRRRLP